METEIYIAYTATKVFGGKFERVNTTGGEVEIYLNEGIEYYPVINQRGDILLTGFKVGRIMLDGQYILAKLDKGSPYFETYFTVNSGLRAV